MNKKILAFLVLVGIIFGVYLGWKDVSLADLIYYFSSIIFMLIFCHFIYILYIQIRLLKAINKELDFKKAQHLINKLPKNQIFYITNDINRALISYLTGDFLESINIFKNLEKNIEKQKNQALKCIYYNNLLSCYLDANEQKLAQQLFEKQSKLFQKILSSRKSPKYLKNMLKGTLIRYEIEFGDPKQAKDNLVSLFPKCRNKLEKLQCEYYICLADIKLGNINEPKERMKKIYKDSQNLFFHQFLTDYLKEK